MFIRRALPFTFRRLFSTPALATPPPKFDPYTANPENYRDLSSKVKLSTGYTGLDIEPFPRLKIIEIGRFCLENVKHDIPADCIQRIFIEEYVKHIMELTHETPNIMELEQKLGYDCIELFIDNFANYMTLIKMVREDRLWEENEEGVTPEELSVFQKAKVPYDELMRFEKTKTEVVKPLLKQ